MNHAKILHVRMNHQTVQLLLIVAGAIATITFAWNIANLNYNGPLNYEQTSENARAMNLKRKRFEVECSLDALDDWLHPDMKARSYNKVASPCPFIFVDLGANVGDSLGKFIDAGVTTECGDAMYPGYSTQEGKMINKEKKSSNRLTEWARQVLHDASRQVGKTLSPEHYCYFGLEGNPRFTKQLQALEARVMHTKPRPVRNLHFFTETVGTDEDGPTHLFLDTTNEDKNYWGSSIYSTHSDVRVSSTEPSQSAPVQGISLSTLLQKISIKAFGNHIIIKMDIGMYGLSAFITASIANVFSSEGAEFALLTEAFDSNILCSMASQAVRVDILVELHVQVRTVAFKRRYNVLILASRAAIWNH